jgi:uncharacterized repeat protein (TIGR02543 family)
MHSITYDANGGTSGSVPVDPQHYASGAKAPVQANPGNLAKTGATFAGWDTAADGYGVLYQPGSQLTVEKSNITLYALWSGLYTVGYDANGGSSGTPPQDANTYVQGASVSVAGNSGAMSLPGYAFAGWNTDSQGTGISYAVGSTLIMGRSDLTLYAVWSPTFSVTYDPNYIGTVTGGAVPIDSGAYIHNSQITVLGNTGSLTDYGYTFAGWNTSASGSGTTYTGGSVFTMAWANVRLYAIWTKDPTYSVIYNPSGATGSVPVDANHYLTSETATVLANTGGLVKTGFGLAGWSTQAGGAGTVYQPGSTFSIGTHDVTLYADWQPNTVVTFDANGATGTVPAAVAGLPASTTVIPANTGNLVKAGFVFGGWNTQQNGQGNTYSVGSTLTLPNSSLTLYALWIPLYAVTYSSNGGTGATPAGASFTSGSVVTVSANTGPVSRSGYVFAGWNTQPDGSGTTYQAGASFLMPSSAVVLYALWQPLLSVIYNANGATGGTPPTDSQTYLSGATAQVLGNVGNLVKTGFQFAGWNTQSNGGGTTYTAGQTLTLGTANSTLYALWAPTYTVSYFGNGASAGTVPTDGTAYIAGGSVLVLGNSGALSLSGQQLAGWNTKADGTGTSYAPGATLAMGTSNLSLYAIWVSSNLTVSASGSNITVTGYSTAPSGSLTLTAGITGVAAGALSNSPSLASVSIPITVTNIGSGAFAYCGALTSITVATGNTHYKSDSSGVLLDAAGVTLIQAPGALSGSYSLPAGVTAIAASAFVDCVLMTSVVLPAGLTSIANGAFDGCTGLTAVSLPASLTSLGNGAFFGCSNLVSVSVLATVPPSLSASSMAFSGTSLSLVISVPSADLEAYMTATGWSFYGADIVGN